MPEPLQTATRDLIGARTDREIQRAATTAMGRLLDADFCTLTTTGPGPSGAEHAGSDSPDASRDPRDAATHRPSIVDNGADSPGTSTEPCLVDDLDTDDDLGLRPATPHGRHYRSLLRVPVADRGALVALACETAAFDVDDLEAVSELGAGVEAALERVAADASDSDAVDRMTEIANVLSHDVQNSLTIAGGHLRLARDRHDEEHLERIDVAHERIGELVDDMIALARTGDRVETIASVAISAAVERAWTNVETPSARVRVVDSPTIRADESSLRQLLENLFRNAIEHAGPDVSVRVGALEDGIYVADDGPGIPRAERQRVFASGHSTTADGTGFGLSIVRRIADVHGWDVEVSESATGGARFELTGVEIESAVTHA